MSDPLRGEGDARALSDDALAEAFGQVVQEIADRAHDGDDAAAMYSLARRFWDEKKGDRYGCD